MVHFTLFSFNAILYKSLDEKIPDQFEWDTFDQNNVMENCDSGMICINSKKMWGEAKKLYIFPKHCNQVFFNPDVLDRDWWFVLRHDPRSKHIFENNSVNMPSEEDNEGDDNRERYVHILFYH